eukprot:gene25804-biopygen8804
MDKEWKRKRSAAEPTYHSDIARRCGRGKSGSGDLPSLEERLRHGAIPHCPIACSEAPSKKDTFPMLISDQSPIAFHRSGLAMLLSQS